MEENKKNGNKIIIGVIALLLIVVSFFGGYFVNDLTRGEKKESNKEENKQQENKQEENKQEEVYNNPYSAELDKMKIELITDIISNNYYAYKVNCVTMIIGDEINETTIYEEVSLDSISTIINTLKKSNKVDKDIPVGYIGCSPKGVSYIITNTKESYEGKKFIAMYDESGKILDIGMNGTGYRFHFDNVNTLNNLIENLK